MREHRKAGAARRSRAARGRRSCWPTSSRMGELARSLVIQCKQAFERRDVGLAQDLVRQDDEIDRLNRASFHRALEIGDDPDTREWAMHMMLVARCLERIGDNAVDIGEQTAFVVTGLFREFEDASHPELAPGSADRGAVRGRAQPPELLRPVPAGRRQRAGGDGDDRPADAQLARGLGPARRDQAPRGGGRPHHPRHPPPALQHHHDPARPGGHPRPGGGSRRRGRLHRGGRRRARPLQDRGADGAGRRADRRAARRRPRAGGGDRQARHPRAR